MKKLLLLLLLFTTLVFSSATYAVWTKIINSNAMALYVDFDTIKKHGGYVYYWELGDYFKPDQFGDLSAKVYREVDCKLFRTKVLSDSFHTEPMGKGIPSSSSNTPDEEWRYPAPNTPTRSILKKVCSK
ncbi:hypothetical protein OAL85_03510 [Methylophilaceae bacterium]|nr:hypothetical protein [Methylophilaceae bacterium]